MIIPNSKPTQVTFSTKPTNQDAVVAATQISKATQVRLAALDAHDNANFRLQKATESLKATEVAYHEALAKNAWNAEELRKAYSNALLGFRDADKAAQAAAADYTIAKNALESLNSIAKREFSDKKRQELASKGHALPDGSFPIVTASDLKNAVQSIGRAKNPDAAKAHIISRAKDLGATSALPEEWKVSKAKDEKTMPWEEDSSEDSSNADDSSAPAKKSVSPFHFESLLKGESKYPVAKGEVDPDCKTCKGTGKIKGGNVDCPTCVKKD